MTRVLYAALVWLALACAGAAANPADAAEDAVRQVLVLLNLPPQHYRPDTDYSGVYGAAPGHAARRRLASQLAREHGLTLVTDWPMPLLGVDCYVMQIPAGDAPERTPERVAEAISRDPRVAWAEPMKVYRGQEAGRSAIALHNDPLYPVQPAAQVWRLAELHELATGRGVRIAIVDSGVQTEHPDLAGQVVAAENFVDGRPYVAERHGTAVAGIVGALADNGIGIAGVAPQAKLLALRACWQQSLDTLCTSLGLAKALHFAVTHEAVVINLSLSGPKDRLLGQLVDAALSRGITVVAAADPALPDGGFPASHAGVWAVADNASGLSARVLHAPGRDVPTTVPGGGWQLLSGSSYASAHVAGLAALLRELAAAPSSPVDSSSLVLLAAGQIDTCATLMRVAGPRVCSCAVVRSRTVAAPATRPGLDRP